jgi:DNA-binding MurR/RpiR family transcriptional regulator
MVVNLSNGKQSAPANYEGVVNLITASFDQLSKANQQIARFLTQNPNAVALESIQSISAKIKVHPSSLVRFAQQFGYSGYREMQSVFQTRLATAAPGFHERVKVLDAELSRNASHGNLGLLRNIAVRDIAALQALLGTIKEADLSDAARLIANAETVYIAGQLRSEPVALLLRYILTMLRKRVVLLDPSGGLAQEMATTMNREDVLIAISFRHYAKEVVAIVEQATGRPTPVVVITDSQLSPIAKEADVVFTVPEEDYNFSRSLAAPMCLAQALGTATAFHLRPAVKGNVRIPSVTEIVHGQSVRFAKRVRKRPAN